MTTIMVAFCKALKSVTQLCSYSSNIINTHLAIY